MPPHRITITLTERSLEILRKMQKETGGSQSAAMNNCLSYMDTLDDRVARAIDLVRSRHNEDTRQILKEELQRVTVAPK